VLVEFLGGVLGSWSLGQRPSRHVLLLARVSRSLGHVTAGAHSSRSGDLALEALLTALVAEGVEGLFLGFWALVNEVLGSRVSIVVDSVLHAGFSSNFGGADSGSTSVVGNDGVIEEERVLVVIILGLGGHHATGLTEGLFGSLKYLSAVTRFD
jgi:hypothetical protein